LDWIRPPRTDRIRKRNITGDVSGPKPDPDPYINPLKNFYTVYKFNFKNELFFNKNCWKKDLKK
jgi:hypothetical protein